MANTECMFSDSLSDVVVRKVRVSNTPINENSIKVLKPGSQSQSM